MLGDCDMGRRYNLNRQDSKGVETMAKPKIPRRPKVKRDSRCLLCGKWFYSEEVEKCTKCGGLCRVCPSDEMAMCGRRPVSEYSIL